MSNEVFRAFSSLPASQRATDLLVAAGIPKSCIKVDVRVDEASGTEGNFSVGNQGEGHTPFHDSTIMIDDRDYEEDFATVRWRGTVLLTVNTNDDEQRAKATAVLDSIPKPPLT
ncbi:MAG: hypothetical protein ABI351_04030 [Herbaspirillum sp.]